MAVEDENEEAQPVQIVDKTDKTKKGSVRTKGSVNAQTVEVVDASGSQVTTFGADPVGLKDTGGTPIDPAKEDGKLADIKTNTDKLDVNLSTRAVETGGNLDTIAGDTPALNDDSVKGLLRSKGDAGATPTNITGETELKKLDRVATAVEIMDDWDDSDQCKTVSFEMPDGTLDQAFIDELKMINLGTKYRLVSDWEDQTEIDSWTIWTSAGVTSKIALGTTVTVHGNYLQAGLEDISANKPCRTYKTFSAMDLTAWFEEGYICFYYRDGYGESGNVVSGSVIIGNGAVASGRPANYNQYNLSQTQRDTAANWILIKFKLAEPDSTVGVVDWSAITFFSFDFTYNSLSWTNGNWTGGKFDWLHLLDYGVIAQIVGEDKNRVQRALKARDTRQLHTIPCGDFSYKRCTADTQVKDSAGFLHTITFSQTASAAPTAGVLTIYDNTAESGTVIQTIYFSTAVLLPVTIVLDVECATGIYCGFDATLAGIEAVFSYL